MKKLLILLMLAMCSGSLQAQQRSTGQWIIKASGGIVSGPHIGAYGELGFEKLFGNTASSLHVSFMFRNQNFDTPINHKVGVQHYDVLVQYGYQLLKNKNLPILWILSAGMYVGYENIPSMVIPEVYTIDKSGFRYGMAIATQVEFILTDSFNIYVQPMGIYTFNSNIEKFAFIPGIGMKFFF